MRKLALSGAGFSLQGLVLATLGTGFTACGKHPHLIIVILSEAKNLSFFSWAQPEERFFASLRMTRRGGAFHFPLHLPNSVQPFCSITSVDLMTAETRSPTFSFISSALRRVITLSIRFLPTWTVT